MGRLAHGPPVIIAWCGRILEVKSPHSDRGRGSSSQRGYDARWRRYRDWFLSQHPLCELCLSLGRTMAGFAVDHKTPHRGDQKLFWDETNHWTLCEHCHNAHKQRQEKSGWLAGCDVNGMPLDQNHHWKHGRT